MKRALISVSDKTGIAAFASRLCDLGWELISTGGTCRALREAGLTVMEVSDLTHFPECLDGRVKTLHPAVHAGLLAMRSNEEHMKQLSELGIDTIDMVVVNLYPFRETILKEGVTREEAVENIDIGGPTMLRAAAKNYQDVIVITDPADYGRILDELGTGEVSLDTKFHLMQKVFEHTSAYDTMIAGYLKEQRGDYEFGPTLTLTYEKVADMRYGENPHQKAAFYREVGERRGCLVDAVQLNGKELSFNNINDAHGALELMKEFDEPTVVASKHGNPCGVGSAGTILEAWNKAYQADPTSVFGGIVAINRPVDEQLAEAMLPVFLEVVMAPSYTDGALERFRTKKNIRILQIPEITTKAMPHALDMKKVGGGLIVQEIDSKLFGDEPWKVVTTARPDEKTIEDLKFAWRIVKYVKSNGIALARDGQSIGIGPGQVNRVWATRQAIDHARELLGEDAPRGSVMASDAFFPFPDCVQAAHEAGIKAIIQPGGSVRDQESIDACNEYGIAMIFTGMRHFRH